MKPKVLCFFNMASIYRENIYTKMDEELKCDFIFGPVDHNIVPFNFEKLNGFKKLMPRKYILSDKLFYEPGSLKFIKKGSYDVLIMTGDTHSLTTWSILLFGYITHFKIILWTHGYYGSEKFLTKLIRKFMYSMAYKLFLYGNHAKHLLIENHIVPARKITVIYNSLNYDLQLPLRKQITNDPIYQDHFDNNGYNIIFLGRLNKYKRLDMLIHIIYELKQKGYKCNATLIGDGPELANLEFLVSEMNLKENIWFYGACYDEKKLATLIFNADICVSPGNIGLTAMHCMMFGTPVITHNNFQNQGPEFEAVVEGKTGAFFEENNTVSLLDVTLSWLTHYGKDRVAIRNNCYEIMDTKFNPNFQIATIKKVIQDC